MDILLIIMACVNILIGIIDLMCDKVTLGVGMILIGCLLFLIC